MLERWDERPRREVLRPRLEIDQGNRSVIRPPPGSGTILRYRRNYSYSAETRHNLCSETTAPDLTRTFTMNRRNLLIALIGATGVATGTAVAQKRTAPNPQDKLALADGDVKALLLLMDTDNNGKISKREWMSFMEAEFNKLDKDGSGELDPKELLQSRLVVRHTNPLDVNK